MLNSQQEYSDEQIVEQIQKGENELFEILYNRHVNYIAGIVAYQIHKCSDKGGADIEDLVSEIVTKIFKNIDQYDRNRGATFKTWISNITKYYLIDELVKKKKEQIVSIYENESGIDDEDESAGRSIIDKKSAKEAEHDEKLVIQDACETIFNAIQGLKNETFKNILISRFILNIPDDEIAQLQGVTEGCIRSQACSAVQKFAEEFISANDDCPGILEAMADKLRGELNLTEKQLESISNEKAKEAIHLRVFHKMPVEDIIKKLKIPRKAYYELIKTGLSELGRGGLTRKMKEPKIEEKMSDEEVNTVADYIDLVLSSDELPKKTRAINESDKIRNMKAAVDLLAIATKPLRNPCGDIPDTLGAMVQKKMKEKNIDFDKLCEKLGLDIHRFASLINDRLSPKLKSKTPLVEKIADFLEMSADKVIALAGVSFHSGTPKNKTRQGINLDTDFHKRTKEKIAKILKVKTNTNHA